MIRVAPAMAEIGLALDRAAAQSVEAGVIPVCHELDPVLVERLGLDPARAFELTAEGPYAGIVATDDVTIVVPRPSVVYVGDEALDQIELLVAPRVSDVGGFDLPFVGGAIGMLGHEYLARLEPTVPTATSGARTPSAVFLRADDCIVFDHTRHRVLLVTSLSHTATELATAYQAAERRLDGMYRQLAAAPARRRFVSGAVPPARAPVSVSVADDAYEALVERALEHIAAGDVVQVVLSRSFELPFAADPLDLFRELCVRSPAPYHLFLKMDGVHVVGASPEQLVGVRDGRVVTNPIAGTRPRGVTATHDAVLAEELLGCPKERAEHMMLVDLGRNDVSRVSAAGSVDVTQLAQVERGAHVMHLVSRVEGELAPGQKPIDALRACFPAGTLTGAPKVRAAQLITELEGVRRGPYGGAIGYIGHGGCLDMAITIRSAVIEGGVARVQAGAGIVARSVPRAERRETEQKARGMLEAIAAVTANAGGAPSAVATQAEVA